MMLRRRTDLHIVRGEYPVKAGLVIGHEPVGVIEEPGPGVTGYNIDDRVLKADQGPVLVMVEYLIDPKERDAFL